MKKRTVLFAVCLFAGFAGYAQQTSKITGEVKSHVNIEKVYLDYETTEDRVRDSAVVEDGAFSLTANVEEPTFAMVRIWYATAPGKGPRYEAKQMFLEPGVNNKIIITDSLKNAEVTGGAALVDFFRLQKLQAPYEEKRRALTDRYRQQWKDKDSTGMEETGKQMEALDSTVRENVYRKFLDSSAASPIGLYVLQLYVGYDPDPEIASRYFAQLNRAIQDSPSGEIFKERIELAKKTAVGATALDFTQPDTLGKPVSLSDFRGKYVLLDFWASWCGPCRAENPELVKAFKNYKDQNFTILGVSLDRPGQKQAWLDAIHKDGLSWNHVSDLKYWDNEAAKLYGIRAIPQNLLIDPQGKIIAKNLDGKELEQMLGELLD